MFGFGVYLQELNDEQPPQLGHRDDCSDGHQTYLEAANVDIITPPSDSYIRIPLGYNKFALIDPEDAVIAVQWRWQALRTPGGSFYASGQRTIDGKREEIFLHRLLMQPPPGMEVDHKNGDGLDCRRSNMRVCTHQQNTFNRKKRTGSKNPYFGVYKLKVGVQWHARIIQDKKSIYLGYFPTPEEAARAYDRKALELRGEYARLNFPEEAGQEAA